jgi:hypothetical protein
MFVFDNSKKPRFYNENPVLAHDYVQKKIINKTVKLRKLVLNII